MQEVFEKILERLLEKCKPLGIGLCPDWRYIRDKEVERIVQEVAAEYNNGWIQCRERLPEEYNALCCDRHGEMLVGHPYFDEVSNTNYSAESDNEMMYDCVAWQPLPEKYKESKPE